MSTTPAELAELRQLHQAKPETWQWDQGDGSIPMLMIDGTGDCVLGCAVCKSCLKNGLSCMAPDDEHRRLIVGMRKALPDLLDASDRVLALEALLRRLRANHPEHGASVAQMESGAFTKALWREVDAALASAAPVAV